MKRHYHWTQTTHGLWDYSAWLWVNKDYERTIKLAKNAISIEPNGAALHFLLGMGYKESGQYFRMLKQAGKVAKLKSSEAKYRPVPPIPPGQVPKSGLDKGIPL